MPTHTISQGWERGTDLLVGTYTASANGELNFSASLADASDVTLTGALTVANLESLFLVATQALKVRVNAVNEVQTITFTGTVTGGSFTLTYSGQTTSAIAWNATAADVKAALEALSNLGVNDVSVTGGPGGTGAVFTVTFRNALAATNVAQLTSASSLTGTSPGISHATTVGGVAAAQTINLLANSALEWLQDAGYFSNPLTTNWTSLLISNDSGAPATFDCRVLYN
jgi:hypothetical protein